MWPAFVSLVALCWVGVAQSSTECRWSQFHLGRINTKIILLLDNMGGYLPVQCKEKLTVHLFPENVFADAEEDSVPLLVLQMGQLFAEVFGGNMSSLSWDLDNVQLLRNQVFRQTSQLQQCVNQDGVTDVETIAPALATFSEKLTALNTQEECAWELIRSEFQFAFNQLKAFLDNRRK